MEYKFIKPYITTCGWECVQLPDSVRILVDKVDTQELLLVEQYRPAVEAYTTECCAGTVDKPIPLIDIAKEEIQEELGYRTESITKLTSTLVATGFSSSKAHLYYATVTTKSFIGKTQGIDDNITTIRIPYCKVQEFIAKTVLDTSTEYLLTLWENKQILQQHIKDS